MYKDNFYKVTVDNVKAELKTDEPLHGLELTIANNLMIKVLIKKLNDSKKKT